MINTVLIDDNKNDLDYLESLCKSISIINVVNTFTSSIKAFEWLSDNKVDLILSDIEMPLLNGIEMLKNLNYTPYIILITAHPSYALPSYSVQPVHYLLKPLKMEDLLTGIERVKNRMANKKVEQNFIFVYNNKEYVKVDLDAIYYIKAESNFVKIYNNKSKPILVLSNLTQFTKQLPYPQFVRIHKSFTINTSKIEKYTKEHVIVNKEIIPFGLSYKPNALNLFKSLSIQRFI